MGCFYLWLWLAPAIGPTVFWSLPCLVTGVAALAYADFYLSASSSSAFSRNLVVRWSVRGGIALAFLALWLGPLRDVTPTALQFYWGLIANPHLEVLVFATLARNELELVLPIFLASLAAPLVPWAERRRLRNHGLTKWPDSVHAALIEEVF